MSDTFENIFGEKSKPHISCRVAYTINNQQPVACTIIGDQPLFYMDFESNFEEEEGLFEDADFAILESELMDLKREIESFDKFAEGLMDNEDNRLAQFIEDKENFCEPVQKPNTKIESLLKILNESRLAKAYIACAKEHQVEIAYSHQIENANYDRNNAKILINPTLSMANQVILAARELRRHFQHRQGALIHPLMFHPDNAILVNRAQNCDLVVSMIRIAWELQLSGFKEAWQLIEDSSMADLGRAFAREAYLDFRTINNGQASAAVFEAWFLSDRCRAEDKILIQQMLADYQGYVFELEDATKNITPTLISALGEMPFGKNYLAEHAITIMEDPIFSDIRDRSNANFLWFIKFERSFRESEQELQPQTTQPMRGSHHDLQKEGADLYTGEAQNAEIITLFSAETEDNTKKTQKRLSPKTRKTRNGKEGGNIVYLRRWSADT